MRNKNKQQLGKIPPQAIDFENAILSELMLNKNALSVAFEIITGDCFYNECNRKVFEAISSLYKKSVPVDMITVMEELKKTGQFESIGGSMFLMDINSGKPSGSNIEFHCRVISEKHIKRQLIEAGQKLVNDGYDYVTDPFEVAESHQGLIFSITQNAYGKSFRKIGDIAIERFKSYEESSIDGLTGVGSGMNAVDRITSGWQNTDLIILAARPAMGKTTFALQLARNAAVQFKTPVAIFSLEMSEEQLTDRLISAETGIYLEKFKKKNLTQLDWSVLHNKIGSLVEANIFIDDTPGLSIQAMRAKAIRLKELHNVGLIIVDYLQLMRGSSAKQGLREQEIGEISRGLKIIAKEVGVPVIALSQLSRAVESRPGASKKPMLSDLRESGSIEQDADQVIFLYRPEYYGLTEDEEGRSTAGICEVIFSKNRNGVCDTALVRFNGALMQFKDLDQDFSLGTRVENFNHPDQFIMPRSNEFDSEAPF